LHPPLLVSTNVVAATTPTHVLRGLLSRSE
jgi:hypothetical protein